jgi:quinol monooxygenase YgiN
MYGTIARFRVKPEMEEQLAALETAKDPGEVGLYVYRMDGEPGTFYLVAIFESKEAYVTNAQRSETDARYQHMRACLAGEPEWHDGEIVFALT